MSEAESRSDNSNRLRIISPIVGAFILYNALSFATLLLEVPLVRLFERSICNRHYQGSDTIPDVGGDVDESLCKVAAVQDKLATVVGWQLAFGALAGLLTAVPYGRLAEGKGRRLVLFLSTSGITLMYLWVVLVCQSGARVELAWLSSVFLLMGGGLRVFNGMMIASVSNALSDSQRTKYLYLLHAGPHVNRLLTPRLAAALMRVALLWPFVWSGTMLVACVIIILLFYQEVYSDGGLTAKRDYQELPQDSSDEQHEDGLDLFGEQESIHDLNQPAEQSRVSDPRDGGISAATSSIPALGPMWWRAQGGLLTRLFSPKTASFCLAAFLLKRIAFTSEGFIFQYTSEKFGWKLEDTTWLRIAAGIGAVITTMIVCPLLTFFCTQRGHNTHNLDLWIIRTCLIVLCASFLLAFEAPTAAWLFPAMLGMGLGEGTEPALQGLITFINEPSDYSQLFGIIALVDNLAELIGGPLSASLMKIGRSEHGVSGGWNFVSSAIMFGSLTLWSLFVYARR